MSEIVKDCMCVCVDGARVMYHWPAGVWLETALAATLNEQTFGFSGATLRRTLSVCVCCLAEVLLERVSLLVGIFFK